MTEAITSPTNPRIKALVRLRDRAERDTTGRFAIEGYRELGRALAGGVQLETLFVCPDLYLGHNEPALVELAGAAGAEIVPVSEGAFYKASYRERPEGLLGVAVRFGVGLERISMSGTPLLLVVEGIEKPGNLGTMLRTAEAAGATGVIVADPTTDPFNPNVVRASLGTLFLVPLAITDSPTAVSHLRKSGVAIFAATPAGDTAHYDAVMTGPTAIVIGSEQYGLSPTWLDAAERRIVIPMPGAVDSLNAAMAAGIVLFEAVRQRSQKPTANS